jgi:hypothetical protein
MKTFWLFRSNSKILEDYHQYDNLKDFENNLWDFYLFQTLWLLRNTEIEEVVIWRFLKSPKNDIVFELPNKKLFIQKFVSTFDKCFKYKSPIISFFRGGFPEYDNTINKKPSHFGLKLYLGANGPRRYPIYGGMYDKILIEDERDIRKNTIFFYKIGVPNIFKPLNLEKKYDVIFPCNFSQLKFKGQEYFINRVSKSDFLKSLKIVHIGNEQDVGKRLCQKYKVENIEFVGKKNRHELNEYLNHSKFGLVTSNLADGCPRISTEILATGCPLLIRDKTRLLNYYKLKSVRIFDDSNLEKVFMKSFQKYEDLRQKNLEYLKNEFNFDNVCQMNFNLWLK